MAIFAVIYRYNDDVDTRGRFRAEHRDYLSGAADQGLLLMSGPFAADGHDGALLLFRADDRAQVAAVVEKDPFTSAGIVVEVETVEWEPVLGPLRSAL